MACAGMRIYTLSHYVFFFLPMLLVFSNGSVAPRVAAPCQLLSVFGRFSRKVRVEFLVLILGDFVL